MVTLSSCLILAKKIIFSDEAYFDLGGYVNKQNCRIWDTENPHAYIEKPTHPKRVTVWYGFWCREIFFENEQAQAFTVNGDRYRAMLNEFLFTNYWWNTGCWLLHGKPRQPFEWNYFLLLTGRIVLSNKKKKFEKIFNSFFF